VSCQVRWLLFLRAKSADKANRLLNRFAEAIGHEMILRESEPYWKDRSRFRVIATCELSVNEPSLAVSAVLQMGWVLARRWLVVAPQIYEEGRWEISGSAIREAIAMEGLTDIDFHVCNSEKSLTEPAPQPSVRTAAP
jgi:hypothetical protein